MDIEQVLVAVDAIYETVGDAGRWPRALEHIATCFGAKGALLITRQDEGALTTVVSPRLIEAQRDYEAGIWRQDFLSFRAIERQYLIEGNILTDSDLSTPEERMTHPFYADFRHRHGLGSVMACSVSPLPSTTVILSLQGELGGGDFDAGQRQLLEHIVKHCERALVISCRLETQTAVSSSLCDTLGRMGCSVFLIGATGRVEQANDKAKTIDGDALEIAGGRLRARHRAARERLDAAIFAAMAPEHRLDCARPVLLPRRDGERPLVAHVMPLRTPAAVEAWSTMPTVSALVLVLDPAAERDVDLTLVRDYLGLTMGEARIASEIGQGHSPRDAAERLGITEETVRTVLKRVFAKTGVSRQSELAATLSSLQVMNAQ